MRRPWLRFPEDYRETPFFPFEGCDGTVFDETKAFLDEEYYQPNDDTDFVLQINGIPNELGQLAVLKCPGKENYYYYSETPFTKYTLDSSQFGAVIGSKLEEMERKCIPVQCFGCVRIKPKIFKLEEGWLVFSLDQLVRGKYPSHVGVIAQSREKATRILDLLQKKIIEAPTSKLSRLELFFDIGRRKEFNYSSEANLLRYQYLKKIKYAYENYDFSALYDDLADDCRWEYARGKSAVIDYLASSSADRKKRNYWHKCTIVQLGESVAPIVGSTAHDGTGDKVIIALNHSQGEYCMIDEAPIQMSFCRLELSPNGKIYTYYDTLPMGPYHTVE